MADPFKIEHAETILFKGRYICPCEIQSPEECQICNDKLNASTIDLQRKLIENQAFEIQILKQAIRELRLELGK